MLRAIAVAVIVMGVAAGAAGCVPASAPTPSTSAGQAAVERHAGLQVLGPEDRTLELDGDAAVVVLLLDERGKPLRDQQVTFTVEAGPARFPGGVEVVFTDADGVASTHELELTGVGTIALMAASGTEAVSVNLEITE